MGISIKKAVFASRATTNKNKKKDYIIETIFQNKI